MQDVKIVVDALILMVDFFLLFHVLYDITRK